MNHIDDIIFGDFVSNNLSHEEMIEVEKILIDEGDADSTLMASMAYYCVNEELAAELIGDDVNKDTHNDRNSDDDDSIDSKSKKQKNMGKGKMYDLASVAAAGVAVSADKLFELYKNSRLEYFKHKNVASMEFCNEDSMTNDLNQAETIYGQPILNIEHNPQYHQCYPDTCAFQSQAIILNEYGIDVTEKDLLEIAQEQGWYVKGHGTPHEKVGKLLEYFGVDTTTTESNNIFNLVNELSQGHRVLVKVDSGELWAPGLKEKLEDHLILKYADHALLVVGVDTSNPNDVKVIVTDPGNGNTQFAYTEKEFMDAWKDSKCFMVSTNESPEEYLGNVAHEPLMTFGDFSRESIERLSESNITMADSECYHDFFEELKNSPNQLDTLMNEYPDLFEEGNNDL